MARELLPRLWPRLDRRQRSELGKVIKFHHPEWRDAAGFPEIEELLTEMVANEELFSAVPRTGHFTLAKLVNLRQELLFEIANSFHEIHRSLHSARNGSRTLDAFVRRVKSTGASIISFNWDCELDRVLFGKKIGPESYGLHDGAIDGPILLKPHGSLNWYEAPTGKHIKRRLRIRLWSRSSRRLRDTEIVCFRRWRAPKTTVGRRYVPFIIPPTHLKKFDHSMLQKIWYRCGEVLSRAEEVYFLGYSLPPADWHSRYILSCGFHNQKEGFPQPGGRQKRGKRSRVFIVNPDPAAFRRIESVVGWHCDWAERTISRWLGLAR